MEGGAQEETNGRSMLEFIKISILECVLLFVSLALCLSVPLSLSL